MKIIKIATGREVAKLDGGSSVGGPLVMRKH
jgi:hypothetical protein